jgi:HrpA-like RNA helicase
MKILFLFVVIIYMAIANNDIGILDPEGKYHNPLTDKPYSDKYKDLSKFWSTLPIYKRAKEIIQDIKDNQVILLQSATGSGKSVLMPKFVLHANDYNTKIAMTLPKQIITKATATFAAETLDVKLGEEVGYQYKGSEPMFKSNKTKLLYATDGTIVARLLKDPKLSDFDCVLVDEVHERKVQIDFLIYLLRETLRIRPEFKIILMSATVNAEIFEAYFKEFKYKLINAEGARTYPIESNFLNKDLEYKEVLEEGFKILIEILKKDDPTIKSVSHDILFFVTSANEAFDMCKKLNDYLEKEKKAGCNITCSGDVYCAELYANIDNKRQSLALDKDEYKLANNYNRKVVISTNVAESSLTVQNLKYIIDSGYELRSIYDADSRARKLDRMLITQAQAKQRMGRVGRTEAGICYHLYTKNTFNDIMEKFPLPDIRKSDITNECLQLLANEQINNIENLTKILTSFIEPPRENYIRVGITNLMQIGAIENGTITKFGKTINDLPGNNVFASSAIVYGKMYNCSREVIRILSMIDACKGNMSDVFSLPFKEQEQTELSAALKQKFDAKRKKYMHKFGDHLSLLEIFNALKKNYNRQKNQIDKLKNWCNENFLKLNTLLRAVEYNDKMQRRVNILFTNLDVETLGVAHIKEVNELDLDYKILASILLGFRLNTARLMGSTGAYNTQFVKDKNIKLNKFSFLILKDKAPKDIVYNELFISMGKSEVIICSRIPAKLISIYS